MHKLRLLIDSSLLWLLLFLSFVSAASVAVAAVAAVLSRDLRAQKERASGNCARNAAPT